MEKISAMREKVSFMLKGEYSHNIDAKGRLIIPAKFRDDLGENFVITKGMENCLYVYPEDEWNDFEKKLNALPTTTDKKARAFAYFFQGSAADGELDKQGRTLIPSVLRTYAKLDKEVVFVGMGKRAEIWDKARWDEKNAEVELNIEEIASDMEFKHKSVLLNETIDGLNIKPDGIYVDGTLGGGGHAYEVCRRLGEKGSIVGIDQDAAAIEAASARLKDFGEKVTIVRSNYCDMKSKLHELGIDKVDGIVLDLGVSSYQLDTAERGFSYREDAPLDMRMDTRQKMTARDIVNDYTEADLYRVIRDYGEDKFAKNIAKHIVQARAVKPVETTAELSEIIRASIPMKFQKKSGHPAKRTFQAIRIELNRELDVLRDSLDDMIDLLNPGGRLCIITFHSLEDRIVKSAFRKNENPCTCPPDFPVCVCGKKSKGSIITKKPILPSEEELEYNSRSKSAKLRIFEHC